MIEDFMNGHNPDDEAYWLYPIGYSDYDLKCGLDWARGNLEDGIKTDSFYGINFRHFIKWAKHKIKRGKK